ncbi:hypothetical protein [Novosphingobium ovatum]|uniref:hypothetical protein n=1 Tax=Novosphingobium ovatum TaxID=1908523 RepID=UPI00191C05FA|nr:hypothetical protein [Novosphingobium ovatum]
MTEPKEKSAKTWTNAAALAGAAIGSAALAAAVLYVSRRKAKANETPSHPEDAPETD